MGQTFYVFNIKVISETWRKTAYKTYMALSISIDSEHVVHFIAYFFQQPSSDKIAGY
ncbi:MAG: hypothetical protein ACI358_04705 [Candidatus Limimorpha sp.]